MPIEIWEDLRRRQLNPQPAIASEDFSLTEHSCLADSVTRREARVLARALKLGPAYELLFDSFDAMHPFILDDLIQYVDGHEEDTVALFFASKVGKGRESNNDRPPTWLSIDTASLCNNEKFSQALWTNSTSFTRTGATPLHIAAKRNQIHICHEVLKKSRESQLETKDFLGRTPLHLAVLHAREDVFQLLLSYNAKNSSRDINGWCLLHMAVCGLVKFPLLKLHSMVTIIV